MVHVEGAAFGISLFDSKLTTMFDGKLLPATEANVKMAISQFDTYLVPQRANGSEAACLKACINMSPAPDCHKLMSRDRPEAVYFLGDGGWQPGPLIDAAKAIAGKTTIHSINFFSTGGGLEEIA